MQNVVKCVKCNNWMQYLRGVPRIENGKMMLEERSVADEYGCVKCGFTVHVSTVAFRELQDVLIEIGKHVDDLYQGALAGDTPLMSDIEALLEEVRKVV